MNWLGPVNREWIRKINSSEGSVMLMALMVFSLLTVLVTTILGVASMESKIALYHGELEQAKQAADAGVRVGRNIVLNCLTAGLTPPASREVRINDNITASVTISPADSRGIVTIGSKGMVRNDTGTITASRQVQAEIKANGLPRYSLQTDTLTAMGKYYTAVDWTAAACEPRLENDPWPEPEKYVLHGPTHTGSKNPDNKNPHNYTYWVEYDYLYDTNTQARIAHNLNNSYLYLAPYYDPRGKVNFIDQDNNPAAAAFNIISCDIPLSDSEQLFHHKDFSNDIMGLFGVMPNVITYEPDRVFNSHDFLGTCQPVSGTPLPSFGAAELQNMRTVVQHREDEWQYLEVGDSLLNYLGNNIYELSLAGVDKPNVFIDWDKNVAINKVPKDFTVQLETGELRRNMVIASPGNIIAGLASVEGRITDIPALFLLSACNIALQVDSGNLGDDITNRHVNLCCLAGGTIKVTSHAFSTRYYGILQAVQGINLIIDYYENVNIDSINKTVAITGQPGIVREFPFSWSCLGMGTIVSYRYLD